MPKSEQARKSKPNFAPTSKPSRRSEFGTDARLKSNRRSKKAVEDEMTEGGALEAVSEVKSGQRKNTDTQQKTTERLWTEFWLRCDADPKLDEIRVSENELQHNPIFVTVCPRHANLPEGMVRDAWLLCNCTVRRILAFLYWCVNSKGVKGSTANVRRSTLATLFRIKHHLNDDTWNAQSETGNPASAQILKQYVKHCIRKDNDNERKQVCSVDAVDLDMMVAIYKYLREVEKQPRMFLPAIRLWAMCIIGYLCMLRFDELVDLRVEWIQCIRGNYKYINLFIPFRKTNQYSTNVHQIRLHLNLDNPELCPVTALLRWVEYSDIVGGYLFPDLNEVGRVIPGSVISKQKFTHLLKASLADIGVGTSSSFGTHSLKRGGVQYYIYVRNLDLVVVAELAGWSKSMNLDVIKRYMNGHDTANRPIRYHLFANLPKLDLK